LDSSNITFSNKDSIPHFVGIQDYAPKKTEKLKRWNQIHLSQTGTE